MQQVKGLWALLMLPVLLSACVSNTVVENKPADVDERSVFVGPVKPELPIQDRVIVDGEVLPLPEERTISSQALPSKRPVSLVVKNLTRKAQDQSKAGDYDAAANSLERGLRIEPRNPNLWNQLADVRYLQQEWNKAIQLAAKSNTLAGSDQALRRENWYLMANAHKALGNFETEQKYRDKLRY